MQYVTKVSLLFIVRPSEVLSKSFFSFVAPMRLGKIFEFFEFSKWKVSISFTISGPKQLDLVGKTVLSDPDRIHSQGRTLLN